MTLLSIQMRVIGIEDLALRLAHLLDNLLPALSHSEAAIAFYLLVQLLQVSQPYAPLAADLNKSSYQALRIGLGLDGKRLDFRVEGKRNFDGNSSGPILFLSVIFSLS